MTGATIVLLSGALFSLPSFLRSSYNSSLSNTADVLEAPKPEVKHVPAPASVRGLYMTACVAGTSSWRDSIAKLVKDTELNTILIDIKDATGTITLVDEILQDSASVSKGCKVAGLQDFIKELHEANIYVIGRISVFQDPYYTLLRPDLAVKSKSTGGVWKDYKGLSFIDVGAKPYWDHVVDIAKRSYEIGFDEINFDYIRYPSDGPMSDTDYSWGMTKTVGTTTTMMTKPEALESFFKYLHEQLGGTGMKLSADLFGMTTTVTEDMNIGQVLERALPYFDYIDPMVYPSHYPKTWNGFANPADHPYEVIKIAMQSAVDREMVWRTENGIATSTPSKMRPWLQDFDLGADYGVKEVRDQIQATYDTGIAGWLVWNAGNKYTNGAYLPE